MKRRVGALADAEMRTDAKAVDVGEGADVTKIAASLFALPSSLSPLDGLQFNGSNWIATGYCPTASDRFECDVTVADAQVNASAAVFGTVREGEPDRTFAFYVRQNGDDSTVVAYGDTARGSYFPRMQKVSLSVGPDGATWTWPGGSDRLALTPGFARDGVTPLLIGDANGSSLVGESVPAGMGAVMKLHRFRIWYGGLELLHDYVPCTDQNGQYGVYDEVGRAFLPCGRKIGFAVNGKDIGRWWKDAGWTYSNGLLSLTNATGYVLSGVATNGEVQVKATTEAARVVLSNAFVFTAGRQAIGVGQDKLTVAAGQVMMTGNTPKTLRYAQSYNGEPCVLSVPCVTVTVKDIPHVASFTVSNAVETITNFTGAATCRVMAGDDVFVGYTLEPGWFSQSANPLVYTSVTNDVVVDAGLIEVLPYLPYRTWNGKQMETCVCSNYTVVAADTATFEDGQWYAVTGTVSRGTITVKGSAHLILCDDAKLTANAITNGALAVYGQPSGCGELVVPGTVATALTVQGGRISAKALSGGSLAVVGGTLVADDLKDCKATIDGGSVKVGQTTFVSDNFGQTNFVNRAGQPLHCVTVKLSEEVRAGRLAVEGLGGYGTNDIYAIDGKVYLWLPDGTYRFAVSDGTTTNRYCAVVNGGDVTAERLGPVGFFANGTDVGDAGVGDGWVYFGKVLSLTNATGYVLSGVATNGEVQVKAMTNEARVVLSNAFVFTSGRQAIGVGQDKLTVAAGQVMMTGNTPKTLRYAQTYNGEPCVLVARAVTVTVKDIPHVTGFTVSNAVEKIEGGSVYRVMAGDDVFVGYSVEEDYCSKSPNPLVYPEVASHVTVDAGAILVLHKAVPITPGVLSQSYATAEKATNAMGAAFIDPRDDVAAVLGTGALLESYRNMFGFAVTGGGGDWFVEAVLTPTARTNLAATVTSATRQIPVGAIARLPDVSAIAQHPEIVTLTVTTNVTVRGCAPGFFYSLYDGWALTNIVADANATNLNVLCGADAKVTFPELKKPSEKAGFFRVGVGVTDNVGKR